MKVAIIGSGISGLYPAYYLSKANIEVDVYEKHSHLGGHVNTVGVNIDNQELNIDTGFIVFNYQTYPLFTKLLSELDVEVLKSEMSFSVVDKANNFEYCGSSLNKMFAQRKNLFNLKFLKMIYEILRFNKLALSHTNYNQLKYTLLDFINEHHFSSYFCDYYLKPMVGSIWSTSLDNSLDILFNFFVAFFQNHGMLSVDARPDWYVIKNGSKSYVEKIISLGLFNYHLNTEIYGITRIYDKVSIEFNNGKIKHYDYVVFANHGDTVIPLVKDSTAIEREIFQDFKFLDNNVVLHTDQSLLPTTMLANSAWNYNIQKTSIGKPTLTYNMSILQRLALDTQVLVSLNQRELIDESKIYGEYNFRHPLFNERTIIAQKRVQLLQGKNRTYYSGAYLRYGFHEDGAWSGKQVVDLILAQK